VGKERPKPKDSKTKEKLEIDYLMNAGKEGRGTGGIKLREGGPKDIKLENLGLRGGKERKQFATKMRLGSGRNTSNR